MLPPQEGTGSALLPPGSVGAALRARVTGQQRLRVLQQRRRIACSRLLPQTRHASVTSLLSRDSRQHAWVRARRHPPPAPSLLQPSSASAWPVPPPASPHAAAAPGSSGGVGRCRPHAAAPRLPPPLGRAVLPARWVGAAAATPFGWRLPEHPSRTPSQPSCLLRSPSPPPPPAAPAPSSRPRACPPAGSRGTRARSRSGRRPWVRWW